MPARPGVGVGVGVAYTSFAAPTSAAAPLSPTPTRRMAWQIPGSPMPVLLPRVIGC